MFKIECVCEDKNLPTILHALAGKALDVKAVPMTNAVASNGALTARTSGGVQDLFAQWLHDKKLTVVSARDIKQFQSDLGRNPSGYNYVVQLALRSGLLKTTAGTGGTMTTYDVIGGVAVDRKAKTRVALNGKVEESFVQWAKENKLTEITSANVRDFQNFIGRSPGGTGALVTKLREKGILKRPKGAAGGNRHKLASYTLAT